MNKITNTLHTDIPIPVIVAQIPNAILLLRALDENKDIATKLPRHLTIDDVLYYRVILKSKEDKWFGGYYSFEFNKWYYKVVDQNKKAGIKKVLKDYLF